MDRGRDASVPAPFGHPELLAARERELNVVLQASLVDVHGAVHSAPFGDFASISKDSFPRGYTYGYARHGKPAHHGLRRIDKIHFSDCLISAVDSVFTTFVGKSNHKAVMLSMGPKTPRVIGTQPQFYCPTPFLKHVEVGQSINHNLEKTQHTGTQWWDMALWIIRSEALRFHATEPQQPKAGGAKILSLLLKASAHKVLDDVFAILEPHGYTQTSPSSAYSMLVHLYELVETDRSGTRILGRLKGALATSELSSKDSRGRRVEIFKLLHELQSRKRMQRLRDKHRVMLVEPRKIVQALVVHWNEVSEKNGKSNEECAQLLQKLGICPKLAQYGAALFKPLSHDMVTEGLRRLKTGGSLGVDGIPAEIFKVFPDVMVPQMFSCIKTFLTGAPPSDWTEGIVTMVPISFGEPSVGNLRPMLPTTNDKWVTNVLLIQSEDVLAQCIPPEQTGFMKNRSILRHIYSARSLWESFEETVGAGCGAKHRFSKCAPHHVTCLM